MRYIKKKLFIEAIQWNGNNLKEVLEFCEKCYIDKDNYTLILKTLDGNKIVDRGDYIIESTKIFKEFYIYDEYTFNKKYEDFIPKFDGYIELQNKIKQKLELELKTSKKTNKKIVGIFNLSYDDCDKFWKELSKGVEKLQNDGQEVEVQYSTDLFQNEVVYSALILGRK